MKRKRGSKGKGPLIVVGLLALVWLLFWLSRVPPRPSEKARDIPASIDYAMRHRERWPVKVGGDDDVESVVNSQVATVQQLENLPRPDFSGSEERYRRVGRIERTAFTVDAEILYIKLEDDLDYHVVIRDAARRDSPRMVVEVPSPALVPDFSPWKTQIEVVRDAFTRRFHPGKAFNENPWNVRARITGIGFFDFQHGQRGMLSNGLELHPVIEAVFD